MKKHSIRQPHTSRNSLTHDTCAARQQGTASIDKPETLENQQRRSNLAGRRIEARAGRPAAPNNSRQHGVTLIEAIIFLSLLSVVLGIVLNKAGIAFASNRAAQATDSAQLIAAGVKSAYQLRNSYSGLNTTTTIRNGLAPDHMVNGNNLTSVWGGSVTVNAATSPSSGFEIVFAGVPADDCAKFVNAVSSGFEEVTIKTQKVKTFGSQGAADPAQVGTGCSQTGALSVKLFGI